MMVPYHSQSSRSSSSSHRGFPKWVLFGFGAALLATFVPLFFEEIDEADKSSQKQTQGGGSAEAGEGGEGEEAEGMNSTTVFVCTFVGALLLVAAGVVIYVYCWPKSEENARSPPPVSIDSRGDYEPVSVNEDLESFNEFEELRKASRDRMLARLPPHIRRNAR